MKAAVAAPLTLVPPIQWTPAASLFGDRVTRIRSITPSAVDETATLETLDAMSAICRRTAASPEVRTAALEAVNGLAPTAGRAELAAAVWAWVRSHVRFEQDSALWAGVRELLIEPPLLLSMPEPTGDCDDFSMLCGAMLLSLGVPVQFIVIAADPSDPERFSHVYAAAQLESGAWMAIDASHGSYAGWQAPQAFRRVPWFVAPDGSNDLLWIAAAIAFGAVLLFFKGRA